jgi:hypothetical protein
MVDCRININHFIMLRVITAMNKELINLFSLEICAVVVVTEILVLQRMLQEP